LTELHHGSLAIKIEAPQSAQDAITIMFGEATQTQYQSIRNDSRNWRVIECSLALATKAEILRERSRELRQTSRLIREESARFAHDQLAAIFCEVDNNLQST
jgi:hypothetical protein